MEIENLNTYEPDHVKRSLFGLNSILEAWNNGMKRHLEPKHIYLQQKLNFLSGFYTKDNLTAVEGFSGLSVKLLFPNTKKNKFKIDVLIQVKFRLFSGEC